MMLKIILEPFSFVIPLGTKSNNASVTMLKEVKNAT